MLDVTQVSYRRFYWPEVGWFVVFPGWLGWLGVAGRIWMVEAVTVPSLLLVPITLTDFPTARSVTAPGSNFEICVASDKNTIVEPPVLS